MISIWIKETYYRETDVLIAGGGLMGLWTAYELLKRKPGIRVTICERLSIPALASTRNAGFACFGSPSEVWHDIGLMGEEAVWEVVEMRFRGISKIRQVLGDVAIGFEASGGYELFGEDENWKGKALQEKLDLLNLGFKKITGVEKMYTDRSAEMIAMGLKGFSAMAGNNVEGGLHSGKMVMALQQMVRQMGAVYLEGHTVEYDDNPDLKYIKDMATGNRIGINAPLLLWATNAWLGNLAGLNDEVKPARGQVLLSPTIPGLTLRGTFHFDEGFYYFRNLDNRLLLGGARNAAFEEEESFSDIPTGKIRDVLNAFIGAHLPQVAHLLHQPGWMHWAGIMGMSQTKMPFVKEIAPGQWAALACNGMGVALTPKVAELAAQKLLEAQV